MHPGLVHLTNLSIAQQSHWQQCLQCLPVRQRAGSCVTGAPHAVRQHGLA